MQKRVFPVFVCLVLLSAVAGFAEEKETGWTDSTDLSVVVTEGNSESETSAERASSCGS